MSIEDVQNYFDWFMSIKEERLNILFQHVFGRKVLEISSKDLQAIYYFFKENLRTRKRTLGEIEAERKKLPIELRTVHQIPDYELIEPTHSLIIDCGICFGELLRKEVSDLVWVPEKNKKMLHYGKPVLMKKGIKQDLNTMGVFYGIALQIIEGTVKEDRLIELYQNWKDIFNGKQKDYLAMVNEWAKKK